MKYYYHFDKEKKLDKNTTKMATISVYSLKDKIIGQYSFTRNPNKENIQEMIKILIREYELKKVFNNYKKLN